MIVRYKVELFFTNADGDILIDEGYYCSLKYAVMYAVEKWMDVIDESTRERFGNPDILLSRKLDDASSGRLNVAG